MLGKIGRVAAIVGFVMFFYGVGAVGRDSVMVAGSGFFLVPIGLLVAVAAGRRRWIRDVAGVLVIALSLLAMIVRLPVGIVGLILAWFLMRRLKPVVVGHKTQPIKRASETSFPLRRVLAGVLTTFLIGLVWAMGVGNRTIPQRTVTGVTETFATSRATFTPLGGGRNATATVRFVTATSVSAIARPVLPSATVEDASLEVVWGLLDGVVDVGVVDRLADDALYGEVMVEVGFVNDSTAALLRREAGQFLGVSGGLREFSVILDDGVVAADYIWQSNTRTFRETRLTMVVRDVATATASSVRPTFISPTLTLAPTLTKIPTLTATPTPTATSTVTVRPTSTKTPTLTATPKQTVARDYTVLNFANMRSCSTTSCSVVAGLPGGTVVSVIGSEDGASVSGSTQWYSVRLRDGRTGYVHSSLVREGIIFVAATSAPAGGSGAGAANTSVPPAGPTSFVCPRNCEGAVAMGLSPQQAATCPGLDRDKDGVACYGD